MEQVSTPAADIVIRFAGDSGDGMQLTGLQFTDTTAKVGNDLATFPDFPSEIRAPIGTRAGVSGFQIHFGSNEIFTPGDTPDVLVAMNPAALVTNISDVKLGGIVVLNTGSFTQKDLDKAKMDSNPLEDGSLSAYRVIKINVNKRVSEALVDTPLSKKEILRSKNFYTLGLMYWLFSRPLEPTLKWLNSKFKSRPELIDANAKALQAGYNAGDIHEMFQGRYKVLPREDVEPGTYRNIMGNEALAIGLVIGAKLAGRDPFLGSYPITPATDILQHMSVMKDLGVITLQVEDEIAGICTAIGASYAGKLGMTSTSGPGLALKTEALGLATITELPLVVVNVQRAGPSTGMPTKVEQSDLLQSIFGRSGDAPIPVIACASPADAYDCAVEACAMAVRYMTPVILLSDNYIANGTEPWLLPDKQTLVPHTEPETINPEDFQPYTRNAELARPWAIPGTPGCEHRIGGLEKENITGNVSYDPENHALMSTLRRDKIMGIRDIIPTPKVFGAQKGKLLIVGWGSTFGAIRSAVTKLNAGGGEIAHLHLHHIWPLPNGLQDIFDRYQTILVPELNMGQLSRLLKSEYENIDLIPFDKIMGKPMKAAEIRTKVAQILEEKS